MRPRTSEALPSRSASPVARRIAAVLAAAAFCAGGPLLGDPPRVAIPADHYTRAELNGFRSVFTYDELLAFLDRLAATSPFLKVETFGATGAGRPMKAVIVSKEKAFTPEAARKTGKPVVLVLNSIHGGESDGTEACLLLLRDIALRNRDAILDGVTLVVVAVYNADGYARVGKFNRPNQDGPVDGMGFRTNGRGLDLNRDFLKLDAPETRALVKLAAAWRPELFVDDHVTDGADFQPTLTLAYANEPATPKPVADWLHDVVPKTLADVEAAGWKTSPYVEFKDPLDPMKGIDAGPSTPRYATGYFPLRGTGAILVELHAIKPFQERVRANEAFLVALLSRIAKAPKPLVEAAAKARREVASAPVGSPLVLASETDLTRPTVIDFPAYAWTEAVSPVTGAGVLRFDRTKPVTIKLPVYERMKPTKTAARPAGYLVEPGWPNVEERLAAHGIKTVRLEAPLGLEVETFRASAPKFAERSYQGRTRVTATWARAKETRVVPAGALWVPLDDELAPVAMHLLEPEGPDSLFSWGELSTALEQKEYIDLRVLDPLAEEMLAKDPKLAAEWTERLKDSAFAADRAARTRFFFERTPYRDEALGLLPVYRVMKPIVGADATAP